MTVHSLATPRLRAASMLLACIATITGHALGQNLVVNGGFEQGPSMRGPFDPYAGGSTAIPGWTVTGSSVDYAGTFWTPASGLRSIDLNGTPVGMGGVLQSITTVPGASYSVQFSLAVFHVTPPFGKTMRVRADAQHSPTFTVDQPGRPPGAMNWTVRGWQFTAADAMTELEFYSTTEQSIDGPALDDVSVVACVGGVTPLIVGACRGESVAIEVDPVGTGPFTHLWQVEDVDVAGTWHDLGDGPMEIGGVEWGTISGSTSAELEVVSDPEGSLDVPQLHFRATVINACGSAFTAATTLSLCQCPACPGDFNSDGGVDGRDVNAFFDAWEAGECAADVNHDGGVDFADVEGFFLAWEAGGC